MEQSPVIEACFFIPLCEKDVIRAKWVVTSIRKYCRDYHIYILFDGFPQEFSAGEYENSVDVDVIYSNKHSNGHWGRIWQMQNNGMAFALKRRDLSDACIFVRIDADALILRPGLIERAQSIFENNPNAGQIGQCTKNISGEPLHNKGWAEYFAKRVTFFGLIKLYVLFTKNQTGIIAAFRHVLVLKKLLKIAVSNGYPLGRFAIGPSIFRKNVIKQMNELGLLISSPFQFLPKPEDDVVFTIHVYTSGYTAIDDVDIGGIFAVCGKESWIHPDELYDRGHYLFHPFKYGVNKFLPTLSEKELVDRLLNRN